MRALASAAIIGIVLGLALTLGICTEAGEPIARARTNWDGVSIHLVELTRRNQIMTARFVVANKGTTTQRVAFEWTGTNPSYAVDLVNGTSYSVLTDDENRPLASRNESSTPGTTGFSQDLEPGEITRIWARFPAPPPEVSEINLLLNETEVLEAVPITDR